MTHCERFVISVDKLVASIEAHLKRSRKLFEDAPRSSSGSASSASNSQSPTASKDRPLFTLKQVTLICKRMLQEREEQLREEYDKIVASKLAGGCVHRHTIILLWLWKRAYLCICHRRQCLQASWSCLNSVLFLIAGFEKPCVQGLVRTSLHFLQCIQILVKVTSSTDPIMRNWVNM